MPCAFLIVLQNPFVLAKDRAMRPQKAACSSPLPTLLV